MPLSIFAICLVLCGPTLAWPQPSPNQVPSRASLPKGGGSQEDLTYTEEDESARGIVDRSLPTSQHASSALTLPVIHASRPSLSRRSAELGLESRSDVAYYALLEFGTPGQPVYVQLDTGSSELWINPECSGLADSDESFCEGIGHYDAQKSSTSDVTESTGSLAYGIGSANVTYVQDDISISKNAKVSNARFGVATASSDQYAGILGISYGKGYNTDYKNFLDELADQDVISVKSFSLALGDKEDGEGVIVFGGVDTSKFKGKLAAQKIVPESDSPDGVARYWIEMKSVSISTPGGKSKTWDDSGMPVFLDSGATLSLLPPDLVKDIAQEFGSMKMDADGFYDVDCQLVDQDGSVSFAFDGVAIEVSYKEIIRRIETEPPTCYLGITPSDEFALLGDTFLRSAYAAFDLDAGTIHLAQYSSCGSNVKTISQSSDLNGLMGSCGSNKEVEADTGLSSSSPSPSPTPTKASSEEIFSILPIDTGTPVTSPRPVESGTSTFGITRSTSLGSGGATRTTDTASASSKKAESTKGGNDHDSGSAQSVGVNLQTVVLGLSLVAGVMTFL